MLFRPGLNLTRFCTKDAFAEIKVEHEQSFYEMLQYNTIKAWLEEEEGFYTLKSDLFYSNNSSTVRQSKANVEKESETKYH